MKITVIYSLVVLQGFISKSVMACAVCYGNPDHLMSKGLTAGVSILLATIGTLLVAFAGFFLFLRNRIKKHSDDI